MGQELDPLRFRANIYFRGVGAWEERKWLGKTIRCGTATIKVFDETERCEATSVDPKSAHRGSSVPSVMERTWGHANLGLYAEVVATGHASPGDAIMFRTDKYRQSISPMRGANTRSAAN